MNDQPPHSPCRRNDRHDAHVYEVYGRPFQCPGFTPPERPAAAPSAPADRDLRDRDQLAALLAHHADVLAARWYAVAPGAGAWEVAAAHSLRGHAAELVANTETPAVAELLDSMLSFEAAHRAAPSAASDTERRDRWEARMRQIPGWSSGRVRIQDAATVGMVVADAEQANLRTRIAELEQQAAAPSAPADRDLPDLRRIVDRLAAHARGFQDELDESDRGPWARLVRADIDALRTATAVLPALMDWAAVLREAAETADRLSMEIEQALKSRNIGPLTALQDLADELRRMADEAQQDEAHPPRYRWFVELLDGDEWMLASSFRPERDQVLAQLRIASSKAPKWKDGTPVRRRLVRETTAYTVEAEHTPEPS